MNEAIANDHFAIGNASRDERHFGVVPGLVWAFHIKPNGEAEPISIEREIELPHIGWLWLHLNLSDKRTADWLEHLPLLAYEARDVLLSGEGYQRLHASDNCIHGILVDFVQRLDRPSRHETGHLHFAMMERVLISGRREPLHAVEVVRRDLESGKKLSSVASLIDNIIERVADTIEDMIETFERDLDEFEELVLMPDLHDERRRIGQLRRTTVRLHRQLGGLRTLLLRLDRHEPNSLCPSIRIATGKLAQRLDGLDHEIVAMRDRARMLQEEVLAKTADQTNQRLHWLAILTALFLPPTLVTGFFGMNLKGMPFADSEIGGLTAMVLCVGSAVAVYWLIRKKISRS